MAASGAYARRYRLAGGPRPLSHPADLRGLRVLVVDDDPFIREVLTVMLRLSGAKVIVVGSAEEALATLVRCRPDVLVSDIRMPGEDGYCLLRKVRDLAPAEGGATPAIAITAFGQKEDQARALAAGFQLHLTKPLDPGQLAGAIKSLV